MLDDAVAAAASARGEADAALAAAVKQAVASTRAEADEALEAVQHEIGLASAILPSGWEEQKDPVTGEAKFINAETGETSSTRPTAT